MTTWFSGNTFGGGYPFPYYWNPSTAAATTSAAAATTASGQPRIEPGENDVILGRGGDNWKWPGNQKLQRMALEKIGEYMNARKKGKGQLAEQLVEQVHEQGGRFLRQITPGGTWEIVDFETARAKARDCIKSVEVDPNKLLKRNRIQTFSCDGPFVEITDDGSALDAWTEEDEERAVVDVDTPMNVLNDNDVILTQQHMESQELAAFDPLDSPLDDELMDLTT